MKPAEESYDRIATLAVAVVDAVANTGYCQLFGVKNDQITLAASRIAAPKADYSEASWEGVIGRAVRTGTLVHLPDVTEDPEYIPAEPSTRSELAIPIIGNNAKAIGVFNIESPRLSAFSGHQSRWLSAFANTLIDYLSGEAEASSGLSRPARPAKSTHEPPMIDGSNLSEGRGQIARLVAEEPNLDILFKRLMAVVKCFVDFDGAYVSILSSDQKYSRVICVFGALNHTARWLRMSPQLVDWIKQERTWVEDFREWFLRAAPEMLDAPDTRAVIDSGYRAVIALPVHQGPETRGLLSLLSKKTGDLQRRDFGDTATTRAQ